MVPLSVAAVMAAGLFLMGGSELESPLPIGPGARSGWSIVYRPLPFSVGFMLIAWIGLRRFRGSPNRISLALQTTALFLLLAGPLILLNLNARLDASSPADYDVLVLDAFKGGSALGDIGGATSDFLVTESWRPGQPTKHVVASREIVERAVPGQTRLIVHVWTGACGYPWLSRVRESDFTGLAPPGSRPEPSRGRR
jgi:hypothetical protein